MARWHKFLHLPSSEQRFLVKVTVLLSMILLGLRLLSFHALYHLLNRWGGKSLELYNDDHTYQDQVVKAINTVRRYLLGDNSCLAQALGGQFLLRRHGYPAYLRIGVHKDENGKLHAHAWVESEGVVVIGGPSSELNHYVPLPDLDGVRL